MIGIVLWSDPADQKAVFWCEDQGDLAYYEGAPARMDEADFFYAGDMVQFRVSAERAMRLAHEPTLLHENLCAELPDSLRRASLGMDDDSAEHPQVGNSAHVIPFSQPSQASSLPPQRREA